MKRLIKLLDNSTAIDTVHVIFGTVANSLIGGLFFIFAPRILGPEKYGLFTITISTGVMAASLLNLGIDTGILRFSSAKNYEATSKVLKLALQTYILIGLVVFAIGFILSSYISIWLGRQDLEMLLKIAFSGVIFLLLNNFFQAVLQSRRSFVKVNIMNLSSNSLRLFILLIGSYYFVINEYFLTIIFFGVVIVSILIGKIFVPLDFLKAKNQYRSFKSFMIYNSWTAASFAVSSVPFDQFMLLKYTNPQTLGLYSAPFKVLSISDQLAGNFSRVLSSRYSSFDTKAKAISFTIKTLPVAAAVGLLFIVAALISSFIVNLLFGVNFASSQATFKVLAISSIFTFASSIPVSIIYYYFGQSKVAFFITVVVTFVWFASCKMLIPTRGELGAAFAYLIAESLAFCMFMIYVIWKFKTVNAKN